MATTAKFGKRWNRMFPLTRRFVDFVRGGGREACDLFGAVTYNTMDSIQFIVSGRLGVKNFFKQTAFVGIDALGIALILTTFSGMVIALQLSQELARQGAANYVGALVAMAMLRELGPIMTAVAVIAMVGSAFSAELGTMQVTKQVDALRVLHVNPVRYLVVPRMLSCIFSLPLMTIVTTTAGIMGGMFVSQMLVEDITTIVYLDSVWHQVSTKDIISALTKACVFGYLIAIFSATIGLRTRGGAKDVGVSTTQAVVWSFLMVAIFDYILTFMFYGSD